MTTNCRVDNGTPSAGDMTAFNEFCHNFQVQWMKASGPSKENSAGTQVSSNNISNIGEK